MVMYEAASKINAKIAGSSNPRIAAIGQAMQARTAAVQGAAKPADKVRAFASSIGSGLKAARAVKGSVGISHDAGAIPAPPVPVGHGPGSASQYDAADNRAAVRDLL
ncbi:MAG: hypothetical protein KGR26_15395 [Cyanobacteria bacterium REEB65]|nr:hypothetical protein [Cyanobacteria bacterium REEB65]